MELIEELIRESLEELSGWVVELLKKRRSC